MAPIVVHEILNGSSKSHTDEAYAHENALNDNVYMRDSSDV